ncbi:MAG: BrnT family toxin [Alphaproteobacteria bacterium]
MDVEWDENKNRINIAMHGIGFERAARIFDGPTVDRIDDREDYGEERVISLGMIEDILILVVVHTDRDGVTRIISAGPAKRSERRIYDREIQNRTDG